MAKGKTRTTLVLDEAVLKKLKQKSRGNISKLANKILRSRSSRSAEAYSEI